MRLFLVLVTIKSFVLTAPYYVTSHEDNKLNLCAKFGGCSLSSFGDFDPFLFPSNFSFGPWTIVHGGQKIESA